MNRFFRLPLCFLLTWHDLFSSPTVFIGTQGLFDRGYEVQSENDFILGTRKSFSKQLEAKRWIQEPSKQVGDKLSRWNCYQQYFNVVPPRNNWNLISLNFFVQNILLTVTKQAAQLHKIDWIVFGLFLVWNRKYFQLQ